MKAQTLLPWICVLGVSAGAAVLFVSSQKKDEELNRLRTENQELQSLRTDLEDTKSRLKTQDDELAGLRKDKEDLLRLRNEVRQLDEAKQQLAKQAAAAQADAEQARARIAQAAQTGAQQMQQLQTENQQLRSATLQSQQAEYNARIKAMIDASGGLSTPQGQATATCLGNLRRIDGAKQQWALQQNKTGDATPSAQDLAPFLTDNTMPTCPAGGAYTLNAVNQSPTCSIPGHALPK